MPRLPKRIISLDTETTGVDFVHGAKPFIVTTCEDVDRWTTWTWPVDPLTREPQIPDEELDQIRERLSDADEIVLQNAKFDAIMLATVGIELPWDKAQDTLIAAHLLASNQPHDLTSLTMFYLAVDIEPFEKRMREVVLEGRRQIQQARLRVKRTGQTTVRETLATWEIAEEGRSDMPSAKETTWKYDTWLPAALRAAGHFKDRPDFDRATLDYANADSWATLNLWPVMRRRIEQRGQWDQYAEAMKLPPILADMQRRGMTFDVGRSRELREDYARRSAVAERICLEIAARRGYTLTLPKSGNNGSLTRFCFEVLKLPVLKRTKTGAPSLDKDVLEQWTLILEDEQLRFVEALEDKRGCDKGIGDLDQYDRYSVELTPTTRTLHANTNQTGTDTTRFSSSNPNGQNVKKRKDRKTGRSARYIFGPAEGRELWSLDYENLELRIPGYEAQEADLITLFERPDDPPFYGSEHMLNFSVVYPDLWATAVEKAGIDGAADFVKDPNEGYGDSWYKNCKNGDFAVQYGAILRKDVAGTADRAFKRLGSHARLEQRFAKKAELNRRTIAFAEEHGYVLTMCGYPLLCTRTEYGGILPTVPLSYHVQGTAGGCARRAMVRCQAQLNEWTAEDPRGFYMLLQIHDELLFDFPAGGRKNLPKIRKLQRLMEQSGEDIGVPLKVSVSWHPNNWSKAEKW